MKNYITIFLLLLINPAFGQEIIEPCKFGQPLIDALQDGFTPSSPIGYNPARDILYSQIDNNGNDLSGIYTNFTVTLDPNSDPSTSAFQNGAGLNAEHVYPRSNGAANEPMKSDLHNIFPCKVNVNSTRGNCPFGEIEDNDTDQWYALDLQANSIPATNIDSYSEKDEEDCFFEPREIVKGNIARAIFYFYATYQVVADNENPNFFPQQKEVLYQWHQNDPVDETEMQRNQLIAAEQGNLNPFIADSSLVRRAFFEADASYPSGDPACYNSTTPTNDLTNESWVKLSYNFTQDEILLTTQKNTGIVRLFNAQGQLIQQSALLNENRLILSYFPTGIYIIQVYTEGLQQTFRVFKS